MTNDQGAGLIHQTIPDMAGTEPRPICTNPEDCCRELSLVWAALGVKDFNGRSASENVTHLRWIANQLVSEALAATNALASVARAQYQQAEVSRLHTAIGLLSEALQVGSAPVMTAKRALSTGRSAAPSSSHEGEILGDSRR